MHNAERRPRCIRPTRKAPAKHAHKACESSSPDFAPEPTTQVDLLWNSSGAQLLCLSSDRDSFARVAAKCLTTQPSPTNPAMMLPPDPRPTGRQGRRPTVPRAPAAAAGAASHSRERAARASASTANIAAMRNNPRLRRVSPSEPTGPGGAHDGTMAAGLSVAAIAARPARSAAARWIQERDGARRGGRSDAHAESRPKKKARKRAAAGSPITGSGLDDSNLFSPPASPSVGTAEGGAAAAFADEREVMAAQRGHEDVLPPSPGPPPEHMAPSPADRICLRTLRGADRSRGATIDDVFEPQTVCSTSPAGHGSRPKRGIDA